MDLQFISSGLIIFRQAFPIIVDFVLAGIFLFLVYCLLNMLKLWLVKILQFIKIDVVSEQIGLQQILKTSGLEAPFSQVVGEILFFLALITALIVSLYIVFGEKVFGLTTSIFSYYVGDFSYSVLSAVLILIVGMIVATFMYRIVRVVGAFLAIPFTELVARFAQGAIIINAILRALYSVGLIGSMNLAIDAIGVAFIGALAIAFVFSLKPFFESFIPAFLAKLSQKVVLAERQVTVKKNVKQKKKVKKKKKISLNKRVRLTDDFLSSEVHNGLRARK